MKESQAFKLLTVAGALFLGCAVGIAGSPEDEVASSIYKILPKGWSLAKSERRIVVSRDEEVTFYNFEVLPTDAMLKMGEAERKKKLEEALNSGHKGRFKIQLILTPLLGKREYEAILATLPGPPGGSRRIRGLGKFEATNDSGLPEYYGENFSVYPSISKEGEGIWPNDAGGECDKVFAVIMNLFKKYRPSYE
jgi:hypothetical protein